MSPKTVSIVVTPDDDGICPAGRPDECFYCQQKVGNPHKLSCVMLHQEIECAARFKGIEGEFVFRAVEPFSWTTGDIEFHFNESSWCANNVAHYPCVSGADVLEKAVKDLEARNAADPDAKPGWAYCLCPQMKVSVVRVIDAGPFMLKRANIYPLRRADHEAALRRAERRPS